MATNCSTSLFFPEFSAAYFAKRNLNGGGFQSEGAAEGGCGGNSAAPERSAGAKRRRSFVGIRLVKSSDFVQETQHYWTSGKSMPEVQ